MKEIKEPMVKSVGPIVIMVLTPKLILGIAIIVLGVAFTLDNFGVLEVGSFWQYWPLIFVAVGGAKLADSRRTGAWVSASSWILVGVWWILYNLEVVDIHPIELWPILLVFAGLFMVQRALRPAKKKSVSADADKLTAYSMLSGVRRQSASSDFRGGDLTAIMGGCEVDLRQAQISNGPAIVDVLAFWGGIDLQVPRSFTVQQEAVAMLGGCEDKTDQSQADPDQILIVRGLAVMGGVVIKN